MSIELPEKIDPQRISRALRRMLTTCIDGEKGYALACIDARDGALKTFFAELEEQRASFARALERAIGTLGGTPTHEGSTAGALHRGWLDARVTFTRYSDRTILEECARGERAAKESYERALADAPLQSMPHPIRGLVQAEYMLILDARARIEDRLAHAQSPKEE